MEKVSLTFNEASVLGSLGQCGEASFPELAVAARLTPSEIRESVDRLTTKGLVEVVNRGRFVKLTPRGEDARLNWKFDLQERVDPRLYKLPLGQTFDSAIDAEIQRLRGE